MSAPKHLQSSRHHGLSELAHHRSPIDGIQRHVTSSKRAGSRDVFRPAITAYSRAARAEQSYDRPSRGDDHSGRLQDHGCKHSALGKWHWPSERRCRPISGGHFRNSHICTVSRLTFSEITIEFLSFVLRVNDSKSIFQASPRNQKSIEIPAGDLFRGDTRIRLLRVFSCP